jgi:hypothetical protein
MGFPTETPRLALGNDWNGELPAVVIDFRKRPSPGAVHRKRGLGLQLGALQRCYLEIADQMAGARRGSSAQAIAVSSAPLSASQKPSPSRGRAWAGVMRPARRRSSDGPRRDCRGPRRSKTAECDTLRFAGSHCARFPAETSDRVGRRRFPRSTGPRGTQSRQCNGRSALGGGTCSPSFDLKRRICQIRLSASVMFCRKVRARACAPSTGYFFITRLGRREASPPPNPPPSRGRAPRRAAPRPRALVRGLRGMAVRQLRPATGSCSRRRSGSACSPTGRAWC